MLEQRVALVTGGTRGIGLGICRRLLEQGVRVATTWHRDEAAAQGFRKTAAETGGECLLEQLDVRDFDGLQQLSDKVHSRFGRIDYLINNVGIDIFKTIADTSWDDWRLSQDIILNAPFILCRAVLPYMRSQQFGRIINIGASSKDYFKGAAGLGPFGVHKAALAIFSKTLALEEIRHGITVNVVAPGSTAGAGTNPEEKRIPLTQIPIGRRVAIEEVVEAVMYFLSDRADSVTGQFVGINGGLST